MSRLTFTLPVALALALDPNPNLNPNPNPNPNQGYEGHVGLEYKPSTQATAQSFAGWGAARHRMRRRGLPRVKRTDVIARTSSRAAGTVVRPVEALATARPVGGS